MMNKLFKSVVVASLSILMAACGDDALSDDASQAAPTPDGSTTLSPQPAPTGSFPTARNGDVLLGNSDYPAISYGAFRSTERTEDNVPSVAELKEDLQILQAMGIKVLRTYNTQGFSDTANLLIAIEELMVEDNSFEMYVMLGVWIDALNSWTDMETVPTENNPENYDEVAKALEMVNDYPEIIKVIAVGNEAMVHWAPYHVAPSIILEHVNTFQQKKADGEIPADVWITSSDNFASWAGEGDYNNPDLVTLLQAVDYISVHVYPFHDTHYDNSFWLVPEEEQSLAVQQQVELAMQRAQEHALSQLKQAQDFMLAQGIEKQLHVGETGWSSETNVLYGADGSKAADEYKQKIYFDSLTSWAEEFGASLFFFQAFDEPWKGAADNAGDSEKHFGLIDIDGNAKYVVWDWVDQGAFDGLTRGGMSIMKSNGGVLQNVMDTVLAPNFAPVVGAPTDDDAYAVISSTGLREGLQPIGWEETAYLGEENNVLVLTTAPTAGTAKEWGWGAGVVFPGQAGDNLSGFENGTLSFEIKGTTQSTFNIGFQTGLYDNATRPQTNNFVVFGSSGRQLTSDWVTHSIDISELSQGNPDFSDVTSPFYFSGSADIDGGVVEVRNITFSK
ncbi:hypothetical protein BCU49_009040 [Vibrio breoganii]|uniref:hypothetical protein n=1 Tax=Vibrio breoganii TaxID=553239 RepID=UPI000C82780B|nr:hypothetical protein [Vibrio breoganii]PMI23491.1 hypothetical protein BCU49_03310 [Vibrio breoganii]PML27619.1 hypothetical protein BCT82_08910 [Vibrio breoganii]